MGLGLGLNACEFEGLWSRGSMVLRVEGLCRTGFRVYQLGSTEFRGFGVYSLGCFPLVAPYSNSP